MIESCITFLPVSDIGRTAEFYTRTVGLSLWQDMGNCKIFSCGQGYFGFCQYGDGRELPKGVCLSLNMENTQQVDEQFVRLQSAGADIIQPPRKHPDFPVYSCFIRDPDGYTLEFQKILC